MSASPTPREWDRSTRLAQGLPEYVEDAATLRNIEIIVHAALRSQGKAVPSREPQPRDVQPLGHITAGRPSHNPFHSAAPFAGGHDAEGATTSLRYSRRSRPGDCVARPSSKRRLIEHQTRHTGVSRPGSNVRAAPTLARVTVMRSTIAFTTSRWRSTGSDGQTPRRLVSPCTSSLSR